ncbi:aconitate hydratase [Ferrimicrobium sp.]|uniref:aconitate hydratase n=1 Tax=Ferrimicrobium sp. TaxID=2926050 RepID=UPI0026185D13|nr:aconitate hydratase [Ferrimicrobium sp.]
MTTVDASTPAASVTKLYDRLAETTPIGRERLGRPLTYAEKVLFAHFLHPETTELERGISYVELMPDRVAMQDATAQMALLQFMTAGLPQVAVPSTVHCDHLIQAQFGAATDLETAEVTNKEVYDFLRSVSAKYGLGFWEPGSGIIHQVVLEQYAFPGAMMIGTDSHTPNAGGLSMVAIGVGGADAVDVMVGMPFNVRLPKLIGVHLTGKPSGWTSAKDVILRVAEILTVKGGTGAILEYFGEGARALSTTGKATICNMGAEIGATCSLFPADDNSIAYLRSTGREAIADLVAAHLGELTDDPEVEQDPAPYFDQVIEIDLSTLEPQIVGPGTPDLGRGVGAIGAEAAEKGWPEQLSYTLVGSCTNSSYEDIARAASIARWANERGLTVKSPLLVTPGSERVRATVERDGLLDDLRAIGATELANACGPCIGQWKRTDAAAEGVNSILTSYNRNFPKRNDGSANTLAFIASPEIVVAYSLVGHLNFNPLTDLVEGELIPQPTGEMLPSLGFAREQSGFQAPPVDTSAIEVKVDPTSERLQLLTPFAPWDGHDFLALPVLMKAVGKCTTDHISAAGPWLRYRGHLDNISNNLFLGVNNAFGSQAGKGWCTIHKVEESLPEIARHYKAAGIGWVAIGDENYGEGSSREHAAMEPRYLGAKAIIARSFARIAETNLKKQGVLPLVFADSSTYDLVEKDDTIDILGLASLAPNSPVQGRIHHANGDTVDFEMIHTLSPTHIEWFHAGSALNIIRDRAR